MVTALLMLAQERDYESISITDITTKAGVSRMAYYRNYTSKDDIMIKKIKEDCDNFTNHIKKSGELNLKEVLTLAGTFFQDNTAYILTMEKLGFSDILLKQLLDNISELFPHIFDNKESEYKANFYIGAIVGVFRHWFETGINESAEYIAEFVCGLMDSDSLEEIKSLS